MSKNKDDIVIHATLVPVGRDFHAQMGDRIIVVAGLAVGIHTGDTNVPLRMETPSKKVPTVTAQPDTPRVKPTKKRPVSAAKGGIRADGTPLATVQPVVDDIMGFMRAACVASVEEIRVHVGLPADGKNGWHVSTALRWLVTNNKLTVDGNHKNRRYTYIERTDTP